MEKYYTNETNAQVIIAVLKSNGIKQIVASPGATNVTFVGSVQNDPFFKVYSAVDERSAAYMASGIAAESNEPVVLSCTGATASRNYMPGLTEAYYRKLPVLAITSTQNIARVGNHIAQVTDRSVMPNDVVKKSFELPIVTTEEDLWDCELKTNNAILELKRNGGGPVHINLPTVYDKNFEIKTLPDFRILKRIFQNDTFPTIPEGRIAIFIGSHKSFSKEEVQSIDDFCAANNAVVFCDHTSSYYGEYRVQYSIVGYQRHFNHPSKKPDLLIHIGEITGDYYSLSLVGNEVWRVSEDGEIRDTYKKLTTVFEMPEKVFFDKYSKSHSSPKKSYLEECQEVLIDMKNKIEEVPFSNIWIASQISGKIPDFSNIHFAILNSLRSWNFFELPKTVTSNSNVGGFGIDGCVSSLIGASLVNADKLYFGIIGDLAMFYDLNVLGNRHVGSNVRILLVNNGKGTEFRNFNHTAANFGDDTDKYIAAAGHFGNKSPKLIKHFVEELGYEYISASNKKEFTNTYDRFLTKEITDKPILFEVFTNSEDESTALKQMSFFDENIKHKAKGMARQILGRKGVDVLKKVVKK